MFTPQFVDTRMYSCFSANPPSLILCLLCTLYKHCVILYSVAQILLYTEAQTTGKQTVEMHTLLLMQYCQGTCGGSKRDCFKFFIRKSRVMDHLSHQKAFNLIIIILNLNKNKNMSNFLRQEVQSE